MSRPGLRPADWAVILIAFTVLAFSFSARSVLGLAMPALEAEFGWSRSLVSTAGSTTLLVMACVAPITGALVDRFGARSVLMGGLGAVGLGMLATSAMSQPWHFFIGFGLFSGIGFGMAASHVVSTLIARRFEENRGLAVGFATSGSTAGQLLVIPLLASLMASGVWRSGYWTLGLACLALIPAVWFLFGRESEATTAHRRADAPALKEQLRAIAGNRSFWLLFGGFFICGITTTGVIETHLLPYAAACGFPPLESASAYGILSAFNLCGMILAGWLSDRMNRPLLLGAIYICRGLAFILLIFIADDLPLLFIFAVAFGIFDYSTFVVTASLVSTHIGLRNMGLAMGVLSASHSAGAAIGALMGGVLFDLFARYQSVWIASVLLALVAGLLSLAIRELPERRRGQLEPTSA